MGLMKQVISSGSNDEEALQSREDSSSYQDLQSKKRLIHQKASLSKYAEDVLDEEECREVVVERGAGHSLSTAIGRETEEDVEEMEELDENIAVKQALLSQGGGEDEDDERRLQRISPVPSIEKTPGTPPTTRQPTSSTKTIVRSSGIFPSRFMSSKVRGAAGLRSSKQQQQQQSESMHESPREYSELTTTYDYDELKSSTLSTDEDELLSRDRDPTTSQSLELTVVSTGLNRTKSLQLPEPDPSEERGVLRQTLSDSKDDSKDWGPDRDVERGGRRSKDDGDGCT